LQALSANGPLQHAQRGVAVREPRIIEISVLAQAGDDFIDTGLGSAAALQQPFAQFSYRSRSG